MCLLCLQAAEARGGGGPENVFLVVNSRSWASRTVANHYAAWRGIPDSNIFLLDWTDGFATVDVEQFRKGILQPVLSAIAARRLSEQIDYIVYSSDLPYAVNLAGDFPNDDLRAKAQQFGSINGMTYLADLVMAKDLQYVKPTANQYMQRGAAGVPTRAFRRSRGTDTTGSSRRYYLSTMLAMTSGRGNSVDEALDYLRRSALADGTHPPGTIYFVRNDDIRSVTRHRASGVAVEQPFDKAVKQLGRLGVRAETIEGNTPRRKRDVQGAMMGTVHLRWAKSGSRILPGAICEHLTSYGGRMVSPSKRKGQQARLSELLRYGAAAASGTVSEPYARQWKFPTPMIQVHYARGSTVAEAFYQSVAGPFQLLIVGDPLCRPWARIPLVSLGGVEPGATVFGQLELQPTARLARGQRIDHFELFVNGRRQGLSREGEPLRLDTTTLPDGHHQLRVVAVEASPTRSQGRIIMPLVIDNHGRTCRLQSTSGDKIRWGQSLRLKVSSPGSTHLLVFHNRELVGRVEGASGDVTIDVSRLGYGPVRFVAVGLGAGGRLPLAVSAPLEIDIFPSRPMRAIPPPRDVTLVPGLQLQLANRTRVAISDTSANIWLRSAGVKRGQPYVLSAYFDVAAEGVYQIQARQNGLLKVAIDGRIVFSSTAQKDNEKNDGDFAQRYIPFSLARGMHRLEIQGIPTRGVQARFRFGGFASNSDTLGKGSQALSSAAGFRRPK